ncbi:MAG: hypothetical protein EAZ92_01995 [Candidatus Kapaibacterium sp.]|nr:MAG: hypothetical protein EAZ92_01995 [Candidatus Kapabacteria bacterium]
MKETGSFQNNIQRTNTVIMQVSRYIVSARCAVHEEGEKEDSMRRTAATYERWAGENSAGK